MDNVPSPTRIIAWKARFFYNPGYALIADSYSSKGELHGPHQAAGLVADSTFIDQQKHFYQPRRFACGTYSIPTR